MKTLVLQFQIIYTTKALTNSHDYIIVFNNTLFPGGDKRRTIILFVAIKKHIHHTNHSPMPDPLSSIKRYHMIRNTAKYLMFW